MVSVASGGVVGWGIVSFVSLSVRHNVGLDDLKALGIVMGSGHAFGHEFESPEHCQCPGLFLQAVPQV